MVRFIILAAIAAAGWWVYNNVDFTQVQSTLLQTFSQEKTIDKVNKTRQQLNDEQSSVDF
jgi:predicted negative regulator of RcsB-dependent stress response